MNRKEHTVYRELNSVLSSAETNPWNFSITGLGWRDLKYVNDHDELEVDKRLDTQTYLVL